LRPRKSFATVLRAARNGDEGAWKALYAEFAPALLGYLRAQRGSQPEDLLGEVMLQIVRDLPRFEGGQREFRAWAFTIAHHRLLDDRRRGARQPVEAVLATELERVGPLGDTEEDALRSLSVERVGRLLAHLAPDQRTVLLLRVLGDLTCDQVAQVIGKSAGAVKALQRRGLETVKRQLQEERVTL
jgi:RNA polymerase sigma factor (sigma-70 family)